MLLKLTSFDFIWICSNSVLILFELEFKLFDLTLASQMDNIFCTLERLESCDWLFNKRQAVVGQSMTLKVLIEWFVQMFRIGVLVRIELDSEY